VFDGKTEHGVVRPPLDGPTTYSRVESMNIVLGKGGTAPPNNIWKKGLFSGIYHIRSTCKYDIFLMLCILKKMCDSLLGLLLNIPGKTKKSWYQ